MLGCAALAASTGAEAQMQLAAADRPIETVVVTDAQIQAEIGKSPMPLSETPQNIQIISADLIRDQDARNLDDVLRNVAGVMPGGYYQAWDYFRVRGFDATGYIYLDNMLFDYGAQFNAELYGLEQVEVAKGPSSSLYGQGSLGGLVNLVSKRPHAGTDLTLGAEYGSYNSFEFHLDGNATLFDSPDVQARLVALRRHDGTFTQYANGYDRTYIAPSLTWQIDDATSLTVLTSYQHDRYDLSFPLTYIGAVAPGPAGLYPIDRYTGEPGRSNRAAGDRDALGFEFLHRFNDVFSFTQSFRYVYNWNTWDHIMYSAFLDEDDRTLYRYPYSSDSNWIDYGSDSRMEARFDTGPVSHTLIAGVDHFSFSVRWHSTEIDYEADENEDGIPDAYMPLDLYDPHYGAPFPDFTQDINVRQSLRDTGIYLQEHAKIDRFTLTLGGRYDFAYSGDSWSGPFAGHKDTAFVPRAGVTYELLPGTALYTSYSESFLPQAGITKSGEALKPEKGAQWEVGFKTALLDNRVNLTASLFQLTRENVSTVDLSDPTGFAVIQTGEQRSRGFELDARLNLLPGWESIFNYAYIDAGVTRDTTIPIGDHPLDAPPQSVGFWSKYEFQDGTLKDFGIAAGLHHYSRQTGDLPNTFDLPGYTLVDSELSYDFGPFEVLFSVKNLLNQRYFTGSYDALYVQPGAPRNFNFSIDWKL